MWDKAVKEQRVEDQKGDHKRQRDHQSVCDGEVKPIDSASVDAEDSNNLEGLGFHGVKLSKM